MQTVVCWQMFNNPHLGGKALIWSICKFPWLKYPTMVDFRLPTEFLKYLFIMFFKLKYS